MDSSMQGFTDNQGIEGAIRAEVAAGSTVTVPDRKISYTSSHTLAGQQTSHWNGAVYMAENQTQGYITAKIEGDLDGSWAIPDPILPEQIVIPPYTVPTTVIDNYGWSINDTTASTGINPYVVTGGDPVNVLTGNLYHTERDFTIKGRGGLHIVFERTYNSLRPQGNLPGFEWPMGVGWTHSFNHFLWFYGVEDGVVKASWTDGTGGIRFFTASPDSGNGVAIGTIFSNSPGTRVVFKRETDGTYTIREKNGLTYTFESVAGTANQKARLTSIRDRNGNALTMTYYGGNLTSVTDSLGRSLTFSYNGSRISEVQDWASRSHQYGYDASGDLVSYKNPLAVKGSQNPVTYEYYTSADGPNLDHAMKKYTLPRGNGMTFEYYSNGRVFRHYNTAGETNTFTYNEFRRETVQVNERGKTRSFLFDENGNPLTIVEENGATRVYT